MAKRGAQTELNHDNWNDEEEVEEAGHFTPADDETLKGRVIKKAKRRGIAKAEGSSIFAGFGGFSKPASDTSGAAFDFLKKSTNGSDSAAPTFAFGSQNSSKTDSSSATFSFGNGSSNSTQASASSGIFSFGSGNAPAPAKEPSETFSFGTAKKEDEPVGKSSEVEDLDKDGDKKTESNGAKLTTFDNPIVMPKSNKWTCSICCVQNDQDKDACVCCTEPRPGAPKKPAPDPFSKPSATSSLGSVTSSGFKFGSSNSSSSTSSGFTFGTSSAPKESEKKNDTGFSFGSSAPKESEKKTDVKEPAENTDDDEEEYSKEYLAHLKCLNVQVAKWISSRVDINPLVFLTPIFKDYEKHLKEIEEKHPKKKAAAAESKPAPSAPLLGAIFGNSAQDAKPPSATFTFGSSSASTDKSSTGFKFGPTPSPPKPSEEPKKESTFSFGSTTSTEIKTGFSFGTVAAASDSKPASTGFSFGAPAADKPASVSSGFSFGSTTENKPSSGFSFGSSASTGFSFGAAAASKATEEKKDEAENEDEDEPPKVEVNQVVEEDAFHTVRCKLFYKKEKEFVEKGLGMLHLKKVEGDKTQMVVRAETNLGNILLNIMVSDKMNLLKRKNNIQFVCVPNPPIKGMEGPVIMLVRVKDALMADQLEAKLNESVTK